MVRLRASNGETRSGWVFFYALATFVACSSDPSPASDTGPGDDDVGDPAGDDEHGDSGQTTDPGFDSVLDPPGDEAIDQDADQWSDDDLEPDPDPDPDPDWPDPTDESCIVNASGPAASGSTVTLQSRDPSVTIDHLVGAMPEGDLVLVVLSSSEGLCFERLRPDLMPVSSSGWDPRFDTSGEPYAGWWQLSASLDWTGVFRSSDPIAWARVPPGGTPAAVYTAPAAPGTPEWVYISAVYGGGFVAAWNEAWEIWISAYTPAGELVGDFSLYTDNGRYPTLIPWDYRLVMGFHDDSVRGWMQRLTLEGVPISDPWAMSASYETSHGIKGVPIDAGLAVVWLDGTWIVYDVLASSWTWTYYEEMGLDFGRIYDFAVSGAGDTILVAYGDDLTTSVDVRYVKVRYGTWPPAGPTSIGTAAIDLEQAAAQSDSVSVVLWKSLGELKAFRVPD